MAGALPHSQSDQRKIGGFYHMKIYNSLDYVNQVLTKNEPAMRYDGSQPFTE